MQGSSAPVSIIVCLLKGPPPSTTQTQKETLCTIKHTSRNGQDHDRVADGRRGRLRACRRWGTGEERGKGKVEESDGKQLVFAPASSSSSSASSRGGMEKPFLSLSLSLSISLSLSLARARACSLSSPFLPRAPLSHTPGAALRVRREVRRPDHRRGQGSFLNDSVFSLSSVRRRLAPHFFPSPPLCLSFTPPSSHPPSATPNSQPTPTHQKKRGNRSSTHSKKRSRRGETSSTSTAATSSRSAGSTSSSCSRPRRRCSGTGSPRAGATTRRPRSRRTCSVR